MRKSTRSIFFLALAVLVLGGAVYAELERETHLAMQPLTALDTAQIKHIEIICAAVCRNRRFERTDAGWQMLEPIAKPASAEAIARLLSVARAPIRVRLQLHDYNLAKLGLAPAQIVLKLDDMAIEIGDDDPIEHDRYIRVGDMLVRVPDRFSARLLEAPESELAEMPKPTGQ
jgi:hypothetical protein